VHTATHTHTKTQRDLKQILLQYNRVIWTVTTAKSAIWKNAMGVTCEDPHVIITADGNFYSWKIFLEDSYIILTFQRLLSCFMA
jgi:hypothetical protein